MNKLLVTTAIICTAGLTSFSAQAQSLNYGLMQDMFGEPVTTSANGSPMRASDVPLDMTIISADQIARSPAKEIPDILRHYAGVNVRQNTKTDYSVGIRGYNQPGAERLLVLVNGRQVYADYYGLVNWENIPVKIGEIRQIEIVRGPNTALFGFNATSGVVNIVTFNPLYDDIDYVEADFGTDNYLSGTGVYTFQDDKWAARISYDNQSEDQERNDFAAFESDVTNIDSDADSVNVDVALQLNEKVQMRFEASDASIRGNVYTAFSSGAQITEDALSVRSSLSADTAYGIIDAQVYLNSLDSDWFANGTTVGFANDVLVAQLSDTFKVGTDHTFRIAGEFRNNQQDHLVNGAKFASTILNIKSLSSLWYWNMTDKMSLSVAGRYDHVRSDLDDINATVFAANPFSETLYNNTYDEFGYNIGYVYKVTDTDTVRATVAKGVDLPSTFELGFQAPGVTYGNPQADVSDVHDFQLGYERNLLDWNANFKVTAFYQVINEIQGFDTTSTPTITQNEGDSEVHGIELSLDGETQNGVRWGMNYSYSDVDNDDGQPNGYDYDSINSDHLFNARVGYSPNEEWDYDLFGSYFSEFKDNRDDTATTTVRYEVDSAFILDARVAYKPENVEGLTLSLNGQSLLGGEDQSAYGEEIPAQVFVRAKYEF